MAYKIIITEHAREDTQIAYDHYETQRQGLGEDFLSELLKKFDNLIDTPNHYGYIDDQAIIRDVKIDRFPYVIVFEIEGAEVIVYAIHNIHKHPKTRLRR